MEGRKRREVALFLLTRFNVEELVEVHVTDHGMSVCPSSPKTESTNLFQKHKERAPGAARQIASSASRMKSSLSAKFKDAAGSAASVGDVSSSNSGCAGSCSTGTESSGKSINIGSFKQIATPGGGLQRKQTVADIAGVVHTTQNLSRRTRDRANSPTTVPRTAKGSSSIQQLKNVTDIAPSLELMRYRVTSKMPFYQKLWMTLDDPCYVNLEAPGKLKHLANYYAFFSIFLILLSSTTFTLQSEINCVLKHDYSSLQSSGQGEPDAPMDYGHSFVTADNCKAWETLWTAVEIFAVTCFTLELVLRFATSPNKRIFVNGVFNWIDLMAILPFFIETIVIAVRNSEAPAASSALSNGTLEANGSQLASEGEETDPVLLVLRVLRVLRLARVFKLLKMGNASASIQLVSATAGAALADSFKILVALLMVTIISMIVFAAALAQFEPGTDYLSGGPSSWFLSITRTCWWSLVTLTGVGYGDEYPMYAMGRIIAMICATVGILIVAVPIEVIGRYFGQHFQRHTYSRAMEDECEQEGLLDIPLFYKKLQLLGKQVRHQLSPRLDASFHVPTPCATLVPHE